MFFQECFTRLALDEALLSGLSTNALLLAKLMHLPMQSRWHLVPRPSCLTMLGSSKVDAKTICYSVAFSACEKGHEWQLALGLLSRSKAK
jgi:hypothetical protein